MIGLRFKLEEDQSRRRRRVWSVLLNGVVIGEIERAGRWRYLGRDVHRRALRASDDVAHRVGFEGDHYWMTTRDDAAELVRAAWEWERRNT